MKSKWVVSAVVLCAVGCVAGTVLAGPFDPAFRVDRIKGVCQVCLPGSTSFAAAENGKAYPFGTQVVSGDASSFVIILSVLNEAAAGANTRLSVSASTVGELPQRTIHVEAGKIEVDLEQNYEQISKLDVESHCNGLTAMTGGKFSVEVKGEADLMAVVIASVSATLKVVGPQFTIQQIEREQKLSVACSQDRGYVRVKDLEGQYPISVRDSEGNQKSIPMDPGSVVKILQKKSETGPALVVTVLAVAPDQQTVLESFTYETQESAGVMPPVPVPAPTGPTPTTQPPAAVTATNVPAEWPPWASTTTTTTTTTTRPSPTPVGRR